MIQALPQVYSLVSGTVNDSSISPLASIINVGTAPSHPAFTELDPATYDNATVKAYWTRNGYNKRDEFAVEDEEEGEKNKTMRFVVHADGRVINKARVDTIRWECRKVWEQLMQDRISPIKWGNASVRAHDLLVRRLRSKYPELRLCQDNWKIEHIATNDYPKWYETHGKKRELVKLEEGAVEATRPSKRRLSAPTLATKRQQLETRRESENEKENPQVCTVFCLVPWPLPPLETPQLEPPAQPVDDLEDMYGDFPSHPSGVDGHEDRNNTDTDMPSKSSGAGFDDDHEDADQDIRKGMFLNSSSSATNGTFVPTSPGNGTCRRVRTRRHWVHASIGPGQSSTFTSSRGAIERQGTGRGLSRAPFKDGGAIYGHRGENPLSSIQTYLIGIISATRRKIMDPLLVI